ncbi:putative ubiquitin-like-specific protease 1B [Platanthera guangdongensis]|uniref:Ubiquitin-like-specific protease 1B n=1 Tax=Platanthera guangdongensis TaxID=2320717 RepID=A0ABR2M165_9ASPA
MPCHLTNHWALLVCRLKDCKWEFYDSMKTKRHRSGLPGLVKLLHEEASRALPSDINDWPIVEVTGLPQQANGDDCGVFVLKFMEVVLSNEVISWSECCSWLAETGKFRAEIAADLLTTFSEISSH